MNTKQKIKVIIASAFLMMLTLSSLFSVYRMPQEKSLKEITHEADVLRYKIETMELSINVLQAEYDLEKHIQDDFQ